MNIHEETHAGPGRAPHTSKEGKSGCLHRPATSRHSLRTGREPDAGRVILTVRFSRGCHHNLSLRLKSQGTCSSSLKVPAMPCLTQKWSKEWSDTRAVCTLRPLRTQLFPVGCGRRETKGGRAECRLREPIMGWEGKDGRGVCVHPRTPGQ